MQLEIQSICNSRQNITTDVVDNRVTRIIKRVRAAELDSTMNGLEYPSKVFTVDAVNSLVDKPCPLHHPKNRLGKAIEAMTPWAINRYYTGGYVMNAYVEDGFLLADIALDEETAKGTKQGREVLTMVDALEQDGVPFGVSTGLKYTADNNVITSLEFDHLSILPRGVTPAGKHTFAMLTNSETETEINEVTLDEVTTAINAAMKPLQDELSALKTNMATNADNELNVKREAVKAKFKLDQTAINGMDETALDALYIQTASATAIASNSADTSNKSYSSINKLLEQ